MVNFLLKRPIAVVMAFTAFFILGFITYFTIPVSLLPDIAIPEITIQVSGANTSARELENTVVRPIRQQLMQVANIEDIQSETRDGISIIKLLFDFGTSTDLAFIEVNEKIDATMNYLPKNSERPRVIKASATDIPVFSINLTLKSGSVQQSEEAFMKLSAFAENSIKRRIEQLPEVAMVDITGTVKERIQIIPNPRMMNSIGLTLGDIESALTSHNIEPGSMRVREGYYEYNIKFPTFLRTLNDIENIYIKKGERIFQLKEVAQVVLTKEPENGYSFANGKRAVTLSVIKQADENMDKLKESIAEVEAHFKRVNPDIEFSVSRNQTELLDFTISNLKQNLAIGFILICIVAILFLGDFKSPTVIGLSILISLVICFLFFYIFGQSLNIISISGLIMAVGMMIDSAIIVTENITQYRAKGYSLQEACHWGTTEVITPMLSSTLTTIAVFVPLVFMSGIAGAIFFDQAFAVTVGLLVSYITGIMLLPVLYQLVYGIPPLKYKRLNITFQNPIQGDTLDRWYDRGVDFVFRYKKSFLCTILVALPICLVLFYHMPKSRMPQIEQNEMLVQIDWNENIHLDENRERMNQLSQLVAGSVNEYTAYIGQQQFLLNREREAGITESELYLKSEKSETIPVVKEKIARWLATHYPQAVVSYAPPVTIFEKLFVTGEADLVGELYAKSKTEKPDAEKLNRLSAAIEKQTSYRPEGVAWQEQLNLTINRERLLLYNVAYNDVMRVLKTAFKENEVALLRSYQNYLPIVLAGNDATVEHLLKNTLVETQPDSKGKRSYLPLQSLVSVSTDQDMKVVTAGKNGEFIPLSFYQVTDAEPLMQAVKEEAKSNWEVNFSGSIFATQKMLNQFVVILLVSVLLMYFILAAQFESFLQPFIILLEIPIDMAASLLVLWLLGMTLNLMSAIGIVVTCGIIINDSILKLDAINELRKKSVPLLEAIHTAGKRRLRPIIMTSLTTIFGMVPLLFTTDLGSTLQKPLSVAMIATMVVGTMVSLFIIPLIYWFIYRNKKQI